MVPGNFPPDNESLPLLARFFAPTPAFLVAAVENGSSSLLLPPSSNEDRAPASTTLLLPFAFGNGWSGRYNLRPGARRRRRRTWCQKNRGPRGAVHFRPVEKRCATGCVTLCDSLGEKRCATRCVRGAQRYPRIFSYRSVTRKIFARLFPHIIDQHKNTSRI